MRQMNTAKAFKQSYEKTHPNLPAALYFFIRYVFPLSKRMLELLVLKGKRVELQVEKKQSGLAKRGHFVLELKITSENAFVVKINGLRIPVLQNGNILKVSVLLRKDVDRVIVSAKGFGNRRSVCLILSVDSREAKNVIIKQIPVDCKPHLVRAVETTGKKIRIGQPAFQLVRSGISILKSKPLILSRTPTAELSGKLHNSKKDEQ